MLTLLLAACLEPSPADTADSAVDTAFDTATDAPAACADAATTGSLALSFRMEADLIPGMATPPAGTFYGAVLATADMTPTGPVAGAPLYANVVVNDDDLTAQGGPTAMLGTVTDLPACELSLLGFLDLDGDTLVDRGEPVTLPDDAMVTVAADAPTAYEVYFRLLSPRDQ